MPKPDVELGQLKCAIDEVVANIAHNSPQAEDLERVKTQLIAQAIYAHDNPEELAVWRRADDRNEHRQRPRLVGRHPRRTGGAAKQLRSQFSHQRRNRTLAACRSLLISDCWLERRFQALESSQS
ncbi:hypothetical protein [Bradyrhizobium sp. CCBAU 51753]|uniref:hypothetical protein n=1 Tax=Bradyrhizobium sp. CCBAU 51753 TaxID=1325100 RepID=UPI00188B5000|nr:hypothetical protein [Bradyrhizobium sp. CCBAU 51753]